MGFFRNLAGVLVGIYGIWLIVSTFMVFALNFHKEAMAVYLFELKIIGSFPDLSLVLILRLIIGGFLIVFGKWLYQSDTELRKR